MKTVKFVCLALVLVVLLSGCVQTETDTTVETGDQDQTLDSQENQMLDDLQLSILDESDTVEIGEMI